MCRATHPGFGYMKCLIGSLSFQQMGGDATDCVHRAESYKSVQATIVSSETAISSTLGHLLAVGWILRQMPESPRFSYHVYVSGPSALPERL